MDCIRVNKDNLEQEHICCAISNNKDVQVSSKKAWLADRFEEGLVFLKSVEREKCFIEYIPAEKVWVPIKADNGIQLWYLPFEKSEEKPMFREGAKHPHIEEKGYVLFYTSQCPFNAKYVSV